MEPSSVDPGNQLVVVVDTMLASAIVVGNRRQRERDVLARFRRHLQGRSIVLTFTSVAELRFGAYKAGWSQMRQDEMEAWFRSTGVVMPDDDLVRTCARLRADCERLGHGLAAKIHESDRWIAATALRYNVPLVSADAIFVDVPELVVLQA